MSYRRTGFAFTKEGYDRMMELVNLTNCGQVEFIESICYALTPEQAKSLADRGQKIRTAKMKEISEMKKTIRKKISGMDTRELERLLNAKK